MSREAVIVKPGAGIRTGNVEFLALSEHTSRFNVSLIDMAPHRDGPPGHAHAEEDDSFYILEGEITFVIGDSEEIVAPAGTFVLVPPGLWHTFANRSSEPARILNIHAPAGFDRRLLEL